MENEIKTELQQIARNFESSQNLTPQIKKATDACIQALKNGHKIMFCGNGGSASQSQHLAAELVGRYKINRPAMNALSLTVDTSILTAVGNDYGYETIFARQVEGLGHSGDVLIGLSTSGNSPNVVLAFQKAKEKQILTIALTGANKSEMAELADITLAVPSDKSNNIQEMHLAIGHLMCGLIEKAMTL